MSPCRPPFHPTTLTLEHNKLFRLLRLRTSFTLSKNLLTIMIRPGTTLQSKIEGYKPQTLFYFLSSIFFIFYLIQIPFWTSNADVLVYACRSLSPSPILDYAFLDGRYLSLLGETPLPNYHLGHTVLLWLASKIVPNSLKATIYPSGLMSAICGAFIVGLSFLIWVRLGLKKNVALVVAFVAGLIPSIWYHSLIGEVYALQLFSILLFVYLSLQNNLVLASTAFLFANLVSPTSGLSFAMLFLISRDKNTLLRAFFVGLFALCFYFLVYYLIDSNVVMAFKGSNTSYLKKPMIYRPYMLSKIMFLNIGFFLPYCLSGIRVAWKGHRNLFYGLIIAIIPQLYFAVSDRGFLTELGSFFLLFFWLLTFPIGLGITKSKIPRYYLLFAIIGIFTLTYHFWINPDKEVGRARNDAGVHIRKEIPEEIKILGHWNSSIGVVLGKYGWDFQKLSENYIEHPFPTSDDLLKTGEDSLIIVRYKRPQWRIRLSRIPIPYFQIDDVNLEESLEVGSIKRIFVNDAVYIYRWDRNL